MVRGTLVIAAGIAALSLAGCSTVDTNPQGSALPVAPSGSAVQAPSAPAGSATAPAAAGSGAAVPSVAPSGSVLPSATTADTPYVPGSGLLKGTAPEGAGYRLKTGGTEFPADTPFTLKAAIVGADGKNVTAFDTYQGAGMDIVLVRWDLFRFARVTMTMTPDGIWTGAVPALKNGTYRTFVEFKPAGAKAPITLGTDLFVGAKTTVPAVVEESRTVTVDGYQATLTGDTSGQEPSTMSVTVTQAGKPVTTVDLFMGAGARMVVVSDANLAEADLESSKVQPDAAGTFDFTLPALPPAFYRAFVQVSVGGTVRTFPLAWLNAE